MVQAKTEPAPTTGWTPPVAGSPATWTPSASGPAVGPAAPAPPALPSTPDPTAAQPAAADEASAPAEEAPTEADFLPLRFGPEVQAETEEIPASAETEPEPEAAPATVSEAETPETEPEPQPEPEPETTHDARGSMRSMLFGEESVSMHAAQPATEPAGSELEPVAAEHPSDEQAPTPEPVTETTASDPWRPWNAPPEPEPEVVATSEPEERAVEVPVTPAADGGEGPSAATVVIIEDDPTAATYYATLFRGNGYHVEVANDGVSGVDLCTRLQPQLIMLDVMMPRQNGILVLQTLRASDETKNTPVVVMSNFSEPTLIKRAIQLGALEYVIKTQVEGPALLNALPRWMNHEKAFAAA
jgi:CheY-like chemotaxis protein